jgi:hypothetical protein
MEVLLGMDIKDVFISKARKYNNYQETVCVKDRKCINCTRWRLSFPYTCNDYDMYTIKAETCLNYTTESRPEVD